MALRIAGLIVVVCAFVVWGLTTSVRSVGSAATAALALPEPTAQVPDPLVTITGTVMLDTSGGHPGIPYIKYTDTAGRMATKQLVFSMGRGCRPDAGDLPCVPGSYSNYPTFREGQEVIVTGDIQSDRLVIESIEGA